MPEVGLRTRILDVVRARLAQPTFERLLYPRVRGRAVGENLWTRMLPHHHQYRAGSLRRARRFDLEWEVDMSELLEWYLFWELRDASVESYLALLRPRQTVIDIGANNGRWALQASQRVGPDGVVHAVEPFPGNVGKVRRHLELNDVGNVRFHEVALGRRAGSVTMVGPDEHNAGAARVSDAGGGVEIEVLPLDELVAREAIGQVDVLKLDVEGYEEAVLDGAAGVLERSRPVMFIEVCDANLREQESSAGALLERLRASGYRLEHAQKGRPVEASDAGPESLFDVVARP